MINWKRDIKYAASERKALIFLGILILCLFLFNQYYKTTLNAFDENISLNEILDQAQNTDRHTSAYIKDSIRQRTLSKASKYKPYSYNNKYNNNSYKKKWPYTKPIYEPFDPNTIDSLKWLQLGVKPWTIKNIMNYKANNGVFYKCSDINKLYTMPDSTKAAIIPHCVIKNKPKSQKAQNWPNKKPHYNKNPNSKSSKKWPYIKPIYEPFDPNTIDSLKWLQLGVKPWTIKNIMNYKANNGVFYKCSDINKLYTMPDSTKAAIIPHCVIQALPAAQNSFTQNQPTTKKALPLQLNTATPNELQTLRGIGPAFAKRIVERRTALGGFYILDQLTEIYGIETQVIADNKDRWLPLTEVQKLNINSSKETLAKHPYINYKLARTIANYGKQHGGYTNIEALKRVRVLSDSLYNRLLPYLGVQ